MGNPSEEKESEFDQNKLIHDHPELQVELTQLFKLERANILKELVAIEKQHIKLTPPILHALGIYNNEHAQVMIDCLNQYQLNETNLLQLLSLDHIHWGNFLSNAARFFASRKLEHKEINATSFSDFAKVESNEVVKAQTDAYTTNFHNANHIYKILRHTAHHGNAKDIQAKLEDYTDLRGAAEFIEQLAFYGIRHISAEQLHYVLEHPENISDVRQALRKIHENKSTSHEVALVENFAKDFFKNPIPALGLLKVPREKITLTPPRAYFETDNRLLATMSENHVPQYPAPGIGRRSAE